MSRTIAVIAALAILELGICTNASISENSTETNVPANTESISETAEAEQPAKFIGNDKSALESLPAKENTSVVEEKAPKAILSSKVKAKVSKEDEEEDEADKKMLEDDKEALNHAYMSQDDSNPAAKYDPLVFYQAGCRYIKEKKFQLALQSFNKALELNPRYYEASYRKALVYHLTGYDKYAARRYQDVINHRPDMIEARINLAALHRKHKHYSGAEEQLRAVIQQNFHSFEGHYNLANVLVESGQSEDALKEYKICLKMKPNNPMVHNNLGVLFLNKNYPDEALQEFRKAAQLSPKNQTFVSNVKTAQKLIAERKSKGATM